MTLERHPEIMRTARLEEACLPPSAYCLLFSEEGQCGIGLSDSFALSSAA